MALQLTPWGYVDRDTPPTFETLSGAISQTFKAPPSPLKPHSGFRDRRMKKTDSETERRLDEIEQEFKRLDDETVQFIPGPAAMPQVGGV